jgi:hypothetical protein
MIVAVLKALPKQAAEVARETESQELPTHMHQCQWHESCLDVYGLVIDGATAKPLTAIRLRWWWQKRTQHMCLQALQCFARERSLDEPTQGEIGNVLVGESCK